MSLNTQAAAQYTAPKGILEGQRPEDARLDTAGLQTLKISERDDRLHAALHRPEVRNAIDRTMVDELHYLCAYLETTPKILILSGTPSDPDQDIKGIFASGADIAQMRERRRDDALAGINSAVFERVSRLPMPVIAAMEGFALGGGAELAYAADFRIATHDLRVGNPETGLGIMAAAGGMWRLRELIGEPWAKEILLAGRILNAQECLATGLVSELTAPNELLGAANTLADRIAAQDPLAVRISKSVFHTPRDAHPMIDSLAQAILFESSAKFDRMQQFLDKKNSRKK